MPRQSRNSQAAAAWNLDASALEDADPSSQPHTHDGSALLNTSFPSSSSSPAAVLRRSRLLHHHHAQQPSLALNAQGLPLAAEESRTWQARESIASSVSQSSLASTSGSTNGEFATTAVTNSGIFDESHTGAPINGQRRQSNNIRIVSSDSDSSIEILPARTTARSRHTAVTTDGIASSRHVVNESQEVHSYEHASLSQSISTRRRRGPPAHRSPSIAIRNTEELADPDVANSNYRPTSARRAARAARSLGGGAAERARDHLISSLTESLEAASDAINQPNNWSIEESHDVAAPDGRAGALQRSRQQTVRQAAGRRNTARAGIRSSASASRSGDYELQIDMNGSATSNPSASGFDEDPHLTHEHMQRTDDMAQMTSEMQHEDVTQEQTTPYNDVDDASSLPGGVPRGAAIHNDVDSLANALPCEVETRALELLSWSEIGEDKLLPVVDHERWNKIGPAHVTDGTPENDEVKAIHTSLLEAVAELDTSDWMYVEPTPFLHPDASTSRSIGLNGSAYIAGQSTFVAAINAWADDAYNPYSTFLPRAQALEGSFPSPTRIHRALGIARDVVEESDPDDSKSRALASAAHFDFSFLEVQARELRAQHQRAAMQPLNANQFDGIIVV